MILSERERPDLSHVLIAALVAALAIWPSPSPSARTALAMRSLKGARATHAALRRGDSLPAWPEGTEVIHAEDLEGLLLISASIRGADGRDTTGLLAIDTGAGHLALDADLAHALGIADSSESTDAVRFADRALPRLQIGRLQFDQVSPVLTVDAQIIRRVSDRPVIGLLGERSISSRALWIDYALQTVALIPVAAHAAGESRLDDVRDSRNALARVLAPRARAVPFELAGDGKMLVRARVSNPEPPHFSRVLTLILDTGATKCVLFEDSLQAFAAHAAHWRALRGLSAPTLMGTSEARIAMVPMIEVISGSAAIRCDHVDVAIMRSELSDALSRVAGTTVHGLLGGSFLRRFRVTIDYPHQVLWLEPAAGSGSSRPYEYSHVGLQIERQSGALRIVAVAAGSPAERAGIAIGDEVTAVDGRRASGFDVIGLTRKLEGPPGTRVRLIVRHGVSERTITMTRRRLL